MVCPIFSRELALKLDILYCDDDLAAIQKPCGWFVHQTHLDRSAMCCMPVLRNQLKQWVYPVHRLDRGTSGVVLFALRPEIARTLGAAFSARQIKKEYLSVVRGYLPDKGRIHHAYCPPNTSSPVDAITDFHCTGTVELPYPVGRYETARYSLMRAIPVTGRQHQIRRHCAHLRHPIVGDVRYGDRHHNRFFQSHFEIDRLLLMATRIGFAHPTSGTWTEISAPISGPIQRLFQQFRWESDLEDKL